VPERVWIMTEAAQVSPQAVGYPTTLALSDAPRIHLCSRLLIESAKR
jgi:hypothetical protein